MNSTKAPPSAIARGLTAQEASQLVRAGRKARLSAKETQARPSIADATVAPNAPATQPPALRRRSTVDEALPPAVNARPSTESSTASAEPAAPLQTLTSNQEAQLASGSSQAAAKPLSPAKAAPLRPPTGRMTDSQAITKAEGLAAQVEANAGPPAGGQGNKEELLKPARQLLALVISHQFDLQRLDHQDLARLAKAVRQLPLESISDSNPTFETAKSKIDAIEAAHHSKPPPRVAPARYGWHTARLSDGDALKLIEKLASQAKQNEAPLQQHLAMRGQMDEKEWQSIKDTLAAPVKELMALLPYSKFNLQEMSAEDLGRLSAVVNSIDLTIQGQTAGAYLTKKCRPTIDAIKGEVKDRPARLQREAAALKAQQDRQRVFGDGPRTPDLIATKAIETKSLADRNTVASAIDSLAAEVMGHERAAKTARTNAAKASDPAAKVALHQEALRRTAMARKSIAPLAGLLLKIQDSPEGTLDRLGESHDPVRQALVRGLELMDVDAFKQINEQAKSKSKPLKPQLHAIFVDALTPKTQERFAAELMGPIIDAGMEKDPVRLSARIDALKAVNVALEERAGPKFPPLATAMKSALVSTHDERTNHLKAILGGKQFSVATSGKLTVAFADDQNAVYRARQAKGWFLSKAQKQMRANIELLTSSLPPSRG